jgi:hypothetical protein
LLLACARRAGTRGGDPAGQTGESRLDVLAERRRADQHDERDTGDDDPVLDNVLRAFASGELLQGGPDLRPPEPQSLPAPAVQTNAVCMG